MLQMPTWAFCMSAIGQADAVEHRLRRTLAARLGDLRRILVQRHAPTVDGCVSCTGSRNGIMPRSLAPTTSI